MDKDTIIQLANEAAEKIPMLFPAWYANQSLPQQIIDEGINDWWEYVDEQQRSLELGMLPFPKVRAEAKKYVDNYEEALRKMQNGHELVNTFSDLPKNHNEYLLFCGLLVCKEFVKQLDESAGKDKQQTKHDQIELFSYLTLRLLLESGEDPTNAIIKALENARHEDFKKPSLSLEEQRLLAEGFLDQCRLYLDERKMKIVNNAIDHFFAEHDIIKGNSPKTPNVQSFESLFINSEGQNLCVELANQIGIKSLVAIEHTDPKKNRYKAVFAALWQFLLDQRPSIVHNVSPQKACEAIAKKFNTQVGKNFWRDAKDNEKEQNYYREFEAIMRKKVSD
jgi:hypothetical protein